MLCRCIYRCDRRILSCDVRAWTLHEGRLGHPELLWPSAGLQWGFSVPSIHFVRVRVAGAAADADLRFAEQ